MKTKPSKDSDDAVLEMDRKDDRFLKHAETAPFRLRNILVPIDFSNCSKKALRYAIPLAAQHESTLTLVHVMPCASYMGGEFGVAYTALEADARDAAEKELEELASAEARDVPASPFVRTGSPAKEIVTLAKSLPADLIVISTHGRTGLTHALLGSVAEHVVQHAPCPVLVVREEEREFLAQ